MQSWISLDLMLEYEQAAQGYDGLWCDFHSFCLENRHSAQI